MLNGKREGWVEVTIVVGGNTVGPEAPLVGAAGLRELAALRRRLLAHPGAKLEGRALADGDVVVDFHRDAPGEEGGVESYVLDPVAFGAADALNVLPAVLGLPRGKLLALINNYTPDAVQSAA